MKSGETSSIPGLKTCRSSEEDYAKQYQAFEVGEQVANEMTHQEQTSSADSDKTSKKVTWSIDTMFASVRSYDGYNTTQVFAGR